MNIDEFMYGEKLMDREMLMERRFIMK